MLYGLLSSFAWSVIHSPSAIMEATMPSIFWVDLDLSGFMLPAGSVITTVEASIQRSTGLAKCSICLVRTSVSNCLVGAAIEP